MDCCNYPSILSPQLGYVELPQRLASRQCWCRSFGKACQIGCKYISSNCIGAHRIDNIHSSFPICSSHHNHRIFGCPKTAVTSFCQSWKESLHNRSSVSCIHFPESNLYEELTGISSTESLGFPFHSPLFHFCFCTQCPTLNRCSTTAGP